MRRGWFAAALLVGLTADASAGQVPGRASAPDIPISGRDRVYVAEQFSNTVSVIDPSRNELLGQIRLGDPQPANLSPLYKGQLLVHGLGFSPDHRTLAVVSVGSNSVALIDTATNAVKRTVYLGRAPHEAFFTPDGGELWVTVRGEDYVQVLDGKTYKEKARIPVAPGPGMQIFSPDGRYGFVCSSFTAEVAVIDMRRHKRIATVKQESPFCPNIAATPEGDQVWLTLKDVGKVMVIDREAAVHRPESAGRRPHHEPRQHRTQRQRSLRVRHCRRRERSACLPHRHIRARRHDPGRPPPARHLAFRRWRAGVRRQREWRYRERH